MRVRTHMTIVEELMYKDIRKLVY